MTISTHLKDAHFLELGELLDLLAGAGQDTENVETDLLLIISKASKIPKFGELLTVLLSGLHWPTVTWSPSSTRKAGETCAARFLWRFS